MGLFDFLKSKKVTKPAASGSSKTYVKTSLDHIEKSVCTTLKPLGFKKKGRTFNREIEKGIFQVINFQAGPYPIGHNYEVPGLRENLYGKFTVNLGVCVESLRKLNYPAESKTFYKEYECQIRVRLGTLLKGHEYWWTLGQNIESITDEVNIGMLTVGNNWFEGIDNKEKIIKNFGNPPYDWSRRAKLDVALIVWLEDKEKGTKLFNDYLNTIPVSTNGHKEYVEELAKELGIKTKLHGSS
jgi:hypothetical protein